MLNEIIKIYKTSPNTASDTLGHRYLRKQLRCRYYCVYRNFPICQYAYLPFQSNKGGALFSKTMHI
jgi:hypothetical protein